MNSPASKRVLKGPIQQWGRRVLRGGLECPASNRVFKSPIQPLWAMMPQYIVVRQELYLYTVHKFANFILARFGASTELPLPLPLPHPCPDENPLCAAIAGRLRLLPAAASCARCATPAIERRLRPFPAAGNSPQTAAAGDRCRNIRDRSPAARPPGPRSRAAAESPRAPFLYAAFQSDDRPPG